MGIARKTKTVKALLRLFEQSEEAMSVVDLVERLKEEMNKTTVYRILSRMEEDGIIHSFNGKDGLKWYAKCVGCSVEHHSDTHPHFQCKSCGKVECLPIEIEIPALQNRNVEAAEILLHGHCEECLA